MKVREWRKAMPQRLLFKSLKGFLAHHWLGIQTLKFVC